MSELALKLIRENKARHERGEDASFLDLSGCGLEEVPKEVSELVWLNRLILMANENLTNLGVLESLTNLNSIFFQNSKVSDLSSLSQLTNLKIVVFYDTLVYNLFPILNLIKKGVAVKWQDYGDEQYDFSTSFILVKNCPLTTPPPEIVQQGNDAILRYFAERDRQGTEKLYEAKLVLIGDGRAGKTTLRDKLNDHDAPLPPEDATTKGVVIDIAKYQFDGDHGQPFRVNVWDFAGQDKYQGIHQFFYTHRALYLLVENSREQKTDFDYWLQTADLCSGGSPVIIVHNEFGDQNRGLFNLGEYQGRYGDWLKGAVRVNFATGRGLDELERAIRYHIQQLPHVGEELPRIWAEVRTALRDLSATKPYLTLDAYLDLCAERGIPEEDRALHLSRYLHILGAMLHYADNPLLSQYVILQNEWATDAVYRILDDEVITFESKGRFHLADLDRLWTRPDYARMKPQLLELMKKFKLCYQVRDMDLFIAPQLLPATPPPGYSWTPKDDLRLVLQYEFMPKGLLTRFTVNRHTDIAAGQMLAWNSGVVLEWQGTRAEVTEQYRVNQGTIEIRVQGADRKGLLSIIDKTFDDLHADFQGIRVERLVPCNCGKCTQQARPNFYELSDLKRRLENNHKTVECKVSYENVSVTGLIENVFLTNSAQRERLQIESQARSYLDLSELMPALDLLIKIHPEAVVLRTQLVEATRLRNSNSIDGEAYLQVTSKVTAGILTLLERK